MTPEKIIELAQSVGLTLPKRGDYFFINHEDLGKLLMARSEVCAKKCEAQRIKISFSNPMKFVHNNAVQDCADEIRSMDEL